MSSSLDVYGFGACVPSSLHYKRKEIDWSKNMMSNLFLHQINGSAWITLKMLSHIIVPTPIVFWREKSDGFGAIFWLPDDHDDIEDKI